ncbi:MAG TPA: hypothetical protein VHE23_04140 [Candidatus Acidoferrales bacterium]|nr:hypothetical protein [Candidatus Acidoferrales bacterium]
MTSLFRSKYVRMLEEDVARLRAENRALVNSLLGTAGFPPVEFPAPPQPQALPRLRKRSWHQVQAWREAEVRRLHPDPVGTRGMRSDSAGADRDAAMSFDERPNGPVPHS